MGLLEKKDQSRFEAHLEQCPACQEDLYAGATASEKLRADPGRYAGMLAGSAEANEASLLSWASSLLKRLLLPRVLVPVSAVLAVAVMVMIFQPGQLPLAGSLAIIEPLPYQELELRGSGDTQELDLLLAEGMKNYASGDYETAAVSLGIAWTEAEAASGEEWAGRHQTALFLGLCLLLDDRPDEALAPLTSATESILLPIAERGKWYLAQAHLLREDPRASLPLLESLLSSPVYGTSATDQLQSVRKFCNNSYGS